jgi:hypothetical protein
MWGHTIGVQDNNIGPKIFTNWMKHFWLGDGWETYNTPNLEEISLTIMTCFNMIMTKTPSRTIDLLIKWMQNQ